MPVDDAELDIFYEDDDLAEDITWDEGSGARTIRAIVDPADQRVTDEVLQRDRVIRIRGDNDSAGVVDPATTHVVVVRGKTCRPKKIRELEGTPEWEVLLAVGGDAS